MKNATHYEGGWLCRGSVAYELHEQKEWKKLDAHLKELDRKAKNLTQYGHYEPTKER